MEYRANFTSKTCEKRFLNETFRPFGIPEDARYIDTIEIGSNAKPGEGVEVNIWGGQTQGEKLRQDDQAMNKIIIPIMIMQTEVSSQVCGLP